MFDTWNSEFYKLMENHWRKTIEGFKFEKDIVAANNAAIVANHYIEEHSFTLFLINSKK